MRNRRSALADDFGKRPVLTRHESQPLQVWLWEDTMSQARMNRFDRIAGVLSLAALLFTILAGLGCGGAITNSGNHPNGDPLGLGVTPGPLGSTDPQTIQVRMGSEPSDRIVSLSLTMNSLEMKNSGGEYLDVLTAPITVEFTGNAITTEPISLRDDVYQDTYSQLRFPAMTGQVVFYDVNGQLVSQTVNVNSQSVPLSPNVVLGAADPLVLSLSLDLAQSFTITDTAAAGRFNGAAQADSQGTSSFTVNSLVVNSGAVAPSPVGQPESGSISFLVGKVTAANTSTQKITVQPASGDSFQISYDGSTEFVNCSASMLLNAIVETEGVTQANGTIMASEVELVDNGTSGSELYGILSGYAPDYVSYNLIVQGGVGVNVTNGLVGKNVTLDWLAAGYSVNHGPFPDSLNLFNEDLDGHLVFDEIHVFPGQFVEVEWDTLIVPDPDSSNAGYMQPRMFELEEQTISGKVANYVYDSGTKTGTFTLNVASNASIRLMNPGLTTITVDRVPQTYLRNNPTFGTGDTVSVRGLLFADPNSSNVNYHAGNPVAFVLVADRISK
jgi:hypothetical protein